MIQKRLTPPATQRRFTSPWRELDYLCKKIAFWLYVRKDTPGAKRYRTRLQQVLNALPGNEESILRQEGLALLCELNEELGDSIAHRRREIELMERLHRDARTRQYTPSTRAYLLQDRDAAALQERQDILKALENAKGGYRVAAIGRSR